MGRTLMTPVVQADGKVSAEIVYLALGTLGLTTLLAFFIWFTVQRVGLQKRETTTRGETVKEHNLPDVDRSADKANHVLVDVSPDNTAEDTEKDKALRGDGLPTGFLPSTSVSDDEPDAEVKTRESRARSRSLGSNPPP